MFLRANTHSITQNRYLRSKKITIMHLYKETSPTSYLFVGRLPYVQQLAPQREHAVVVAPDDAQTRDGQSLSRVPLGQDQSTVQRVPGACVVSVVQFRDSLQLGVLRTRALLVHLLLSFEAHPRENGLNHATLAGLRGERGSTNTCQHCHIHVSTDSTTPHLLAYGVKGVQIHVNKRPHCKR